MLTICTIVSGETFARKTAWTAIGKHATLVTFFTAGENYSTVVNWQRKRKFGQAYQ